jgi:tetratricopeptide (TPR) repeat protein
MQQEQWFDLKQIFERACNLDAAQTQAYLDQVCPSGTELRIEVESLLSAHRNAGDFIETPVIIDSSVADDEEDPLIGSDVGVYRIIREVDRGGMGTVYQAVRADDEYWKLVAIKVVHHGFDTKSLLDRFRNERQILAHFDHPNIARLLDGGTTKDGRPYFVMEFVDGIRIDEYCKKHQLSIKDRLRLFQSFARAVNYAHQYLIIHRDLKPSNILVTSEGVPKLLDFGVAKLIDDSAGETAKNMTVAPMTPQYASPEQFRCEPMTTGTDVYSLGVILFELLTGVLPYASASGHAHELAAAICEQQVPKPSTVAQQSNPHVARELRGDLDNIVLKALQKEPRRRYTSALEFADDIERYLTGKPVTARRETAWYRSGKFVRRHKAGVALGASTAVLLLVAFVVTAFQYRVAEHERQSAQRRFNDVRQLADTFIFDINDSIRQLPGSTAARQKLVETASRYLDNLARESGNDWTLQRELAAAYERLSDIQGGMAQANTGNGPAALENRRRAVAIREALAKADPTNVGARLEWGVSLSTFAEVMTWSDVNAALELERKAVAIIESIYAAAPSLLSGQGLANAYYRLGSIYVKAGKLEDGLHAFVQDTQLTEALLRDAPADIGLRHDFALTNKRIGAMLGTTGKYQEAVERYRKALEIEEDFLRLDPVNVEARRSLSVTYSDLGWLSKRSGDMKSAIDAYNKALDIRQALVDADPANMDMKNRLASTFVALGYISRTQNDLSGAENLFRKALALRKIAGSPLEVAAAYGDLGDLAFGAKKFDEALQFHQQALEIAEVASKRDTVNREGRATLGTANGNVGITYFELALSRPPGPARCEPLARAFEFITAGTTLLQNMKQAGQLTNVEIESLQSYTPRLDQTRTQLAQLRAAGVCMGPE